MLYCKMKLTFCLNHCLTNCFKCLFSENNSLEHEQSSALTGGALNSAEPGELHQGGNSGVLINSNSHTHSHSTKCTSDDESSSITSGSGHLGGGTTSHNNSIHHSNSPLRMKPLRANKLTAFDSITPTTHHTPLEFYTVAEMEQLRMTIDERAQECGRLNNEVTLLKTQFQTDCTILSQSLQDEKYRVEVCCPRQTLHSILLIF